MKRSAYIFWLIEVYSLLAASILVPGCMSSSENIQDVVSNQAPNNYPGCQRHAVVCGLLTTADGAECPGADVDCTTTATWCEDEGIPYIKLRDDKATIAGAKAALIEQTKGYTVDDYLFVATSGHGTRRIDQSGDEADGYDEGIVMYDEIWWDDDVAEFVREHIPPCRIDFISDTCHSEGNYRDLMPDQEPFLIDMDGQLLMGFMRVTPWAGQMVQIAGCPEALYSYGSAKDGGVLTKSLDSTLNGAYTREQWFNATSNAMLGDEQVPVFSTYNASKKFEECAVFH